MFGWLIEIPVENDKTTSASSVAVKSAASLTGSLNLNFCRFCHETTDTKSNPLITPCLCKGSLEFVHRQCLERWLNESNQNKCDICQYQYLVEENLRYRCLESGIVWLRRPENRTLLCMDTCFCLILSAICVVLLCCGSVGLMFAANPKAETPQSTLYIRVVTSLFLIILGVIYLVNLCLLIKGQVQPWYRWWKNSRIVRIVDKRQHNIMNV